MAESVTETLANFSSGLRYEDLSERAVQEVKRLLLDTIGCGLGGLGLEKGEMALRLARQAGGRADASIFGTAEKVPAAMAAFVNGELMNALDWCALQPPAHVSPYVMPAVLALAEAHHATGKELVTALVVAEELACRVADSLGNMRAGPKGVPIRSFGMGCNEFGATAGAARILKLSPEKMRHALGLAGYHAPIASHAKYNHTMHPGYAKYGPSGWTAQAGVVTAQLAEMGYRGDDTVLDGEFGFWSMNGSPACDWEKLTRALGDDWAFFTIGYKFWPCCGMYQSPLDAFVKLINEHEIPAAEIMRVLVEDESFNTLPKYLSTDVRDHVDAASSLPYNIAVAAHRVPLGPKWQSRETMANPAIRDFMKRVQQAVYPRCEEMRHQDLVVEGRRYLSHRPARITIETRNRSYVHAVDYANWLSNDVPEYRATDAGLAQKFRANAEGVLDTQRTDLVVDCILHLEDLPDTAALAAMLGTQR